MTNNNLKLNTIQLQRYPINYKEKLQAWDAADEFLLEKIEENSLIKSTNNVLIFNDSFGALSLTIAKRYSPISITTITDSINTKNSLINNGKKNKVDLDLINIINNIEELNKSYNHVIIKIPKSLDYLIYFLSKINKFTAPNCTVMMAGMVKHLPKNLWKILEQNFGSTHTSLAKKKAKIITLELEKKLENNCNIKEYPTTFKQNEFTIYNHAAVFSKQSLDIGTRFLLENLRIFPNISDIIDLGCGNGIVGLNLAKLYPHANIKLTDESYMAVASAKLTIKNNLKNNERINFEVNNCLDGVKSSSADLIVCNPPFHQSQNIGIQVALTMFKQSYHVLRTGGYLIVIANRHLPYYAHLKRIFKKVSNDTSNQKFTIFIVKKR